MKIDHLVDKYIEAYIQSGENLGTAKVEFCNQFLEFLKTLKGKDLAPCLWEVKFDKYEKHTTIKLCF